MSGLVLRPRAGMTGIARSVEGGAPEPPAKHVTGASISAILAAMASGVVLFSTDSCTFCEHARSLLTKRGVVFEEVNLGPHPELQAELASVTGLTSFPQIVVDGEPLGGLNELRAADTRGTLAAWAVDHASGGP
ncbi:MAG: glutaredoxin 3 [Solirubrobacteraceae bacterium]|jgi:glutaredoxin 3|nr:glutaredoxin 3 [Solirubrobacteraceae bacterium]